MRNSEKGTGLRAQGSELRAQGSGHRAEGRGQRAGGRLKHNPLPGGVGGGFLRKNYPPVSMFSEVRLFEILCYRYY